MNNTWILDKNIAKNDWQIQFEKKFRKHAGFSTEKLKFGGLKTKSLGYKFIFSPNKVKQFISELLEEQEKEIKDKIKQMIVEEINICHQEGQATSRLTSIWVKIDKLKT